MSCTESSSSSYSARGDIDPLLKDLSERQQSFRRNVVSLASELNQVRERLARETLTRQEAEIRAEDLEKEVAETKRMYHAIQKKHFTFDTCWDILRQSCKWDEFRSQPKRSMQHADHLRIHQLNMRHFNPTRIMRCTNNYLIHQHNQLVLRQRKRS
ncbi:hypothetical protein CsSME_00010493 [Camellia sinensis var. sinensis]